jgi:glycosyltransferase involved in cell wall biosynthesis
MKTRILVVIPAHNEAESIENVIFDIQKHIKNADILVINDCSTDNTAEKIITGNGLSRIDNIFNLGYAYSVQTGIKYAHENNYDFVIQMDADGQHLASEAKKLLDEAEKEDSDIVIGSRYCEANTYKAPLFRRFGTKMFERLIKIFCHQRITDPLSGFQCLNKRTIEAYSKPGAYPEYPDAGLIIEMIMKGYKIKEVPVTMKLRETGESMHSGVIKPIKYMATQFYTCIIIFIKFIGRKVHE